MDGMVKIWTLMFIAIFYIFGIMITSDNAREYIKSYERKNRFISVSAKLYIDRYYRAMAAMFAVMFPLYYCFRYGSIYAKIFYRILIEDKDENRIASWLI